MKKIIGFLVFVICLLIIIIIGLFPELGLASTLNVEWSYPSGISDTKGFKFYKVGTEDPIFVLSDPILRTTEFTIENLSSGSSCFVMTAFDSKSESPRSSEYCLDPIPPSPENLIITVVVTVKVGDR